MQYLFLLLFSFVSMSTWGQTYEDANPINFYYKKVTYSDFPIISRNKQGIIFYHISGELVKKYLARLLEENPASIRDKVELYRYKKHKFRYKNYRYHFSEPHLTDSTLTGIKDSINLEIQADRFKKKWSWRRFKCIEVPQGNAILYSGYVVFQFKLIAATDIEHCLQDTTSVPVYTLFSTINNTSFVLQGRAMKSWMYFNLVDRLTLAHPVLKDLDKSYIYLKYKPENEEILLYMNVIYKP